jgi:hypothetical protein
MVHVLRVHLAQHPPWAVLNATALLAPSKKALIQVVDILVAHRAWHLIQVEPNTTSPAKRALLGVCQRMGAHVVMLAQLAQSPTAMLVLWLVLMVLVLVVVASPTAMALALAVLQQPLQCKAFANRVQPGTGQRLVVHSVSSAPLVKHRMLVVQSATVLQAASDQGHFQPHARRAQQAACPSHVVISLL